MASKFPEQDILVKGVVNTDTKKGTEWIQNLWTPNTTLEVRPGFGQVAQIDSTLSRFGDYNSSLITDDFDPDVLGFQKALGSYAMKTLEGNVQIISVFQTLGLSTSSDEAVNRSGFAKPRRVSCYEVVIYDVDTDQRWHEVLQIRTSNKNNANRSPKFWHGGYETNSDKDWEDTLVGEGQSTVSFVELNGYLFFGSKDIPLHAYNPSTFRSQLTQPTRRKQVTLIDDNDSSYEPYSESCSVVRVTPSVNEALGQNFGFLDSHELANPTSVTEFAGRLALARDKTVRFSDFSFLSAFKTLDFIQVPSFNDITCITGVGQFLYIFTKTETFLYRSPATGALISGGEIIKLSDEIGCFGPLAQSRVQGIVVFADANGIHSVNGSTITTLSEPIGNLFQGGISSPLSNYTTESGYLTFTNEQPRTFYDIRDDEEFVSMAYDELTTSLFCTIPRLNLSIVFKAKTGFTFWSFEDIVTPDSKVGATRNLPNPQVLSLDGEIYLVGGLESTLFNSSVAAPLEGGHAESEDPIGGGGGDEAPEGGGGGDGGEEGGGGGATPPTSPAGSPEIWLKADSINAGDPAYVDAASGVLKWDNDGSLGGTALNTNSFAPGLYTSSDATTSKPGIDYTAQFQQLSYTPPANITPTNEMTVYIVAKHEPFTNQPQGISGLYFGVLESSIGTQYAGYTIASIGLDHNGGFSVNQMLNASWFATSGYRIDVTPSQVDLATTPSPYIVSGFRLMPAAPSTDFASIETAGAVATLKGSGAITSASTSFDRVSANSPYGSAGAFTNGTSPAGATALGRNPGNFSFTNMVLGPSFRGRIFEIIVYMNPLSDVDFLATQQYLTNKYNLP